MSSGAKLTRTQARALWLGITALDEFTVIELSREAGVSVRMTALYLAHCFRHGVIEQIPGVGLCSKYRKNDMVGDIGGPGNGRCMEGKVWEAIRQTRIFTVRDIAALSDSNEMPISEEFVESYVRMLVQCDYVKTLAPRMRKLNRPARYQLLRNSGPKPPTRRRVRVTVDPNLGEIVHVPVMTG